MSAEQKKWLIKSEPGVYSFEQLMKDKKTDWTGVRNYAARNHMREMKKNDLLLYYHSNEGKAVVGIAKVSKEAFQDPTTDDPNWICVEVAPVKALKKPVELDTIKKNKRLATMVLVTNSRLSVQPVREEEFDIIISLSEEKS